ncbi:unnamed protein product [Didymodactylos carnosus]|uniref:Uncharacterized protein n=1 Tax=Didymodactylos carnosus TaxID=1234261 RepID=A0A8S2ESG8_9BILA|nr:unnamed protein product [Didymodactylos carnosus]CAF4094810.1 unnamed protein product [Didymodactylos carnosus]
MIVEQYQIPSETITNNVVHSAAETFNLPTSLIRVDYGHYVGIGFGPDGGSACQLDRHMYYMHRTDLLSYITSVYPARFSNNMYRGAAFTFTITSEVPTVTRIPTAPVTYDSCDQNLQKKIPRVSGQTGFNYRYRAQYSGYVQNIRLNFYGTLNRVTNTIFLFTISAIPDTSTLFHIVDTYEVPSAQFPDSVGIHNIELLPGALNISDGQWLAISFQGIFSFDLTNETLAVVTNCDSFSISNERAIELSDPMCDQCEYDGRGWSFEQYASAMSFTVAPLT